MENNYDENENIETECGIDLFEIYDYEVELYKSGKISHELLRSTYYFIEEIFLKTKPEPIIEVLYGIDAPNNIYTDKIVKEITDFINGIGITFSFLKSDKIYDIEGNHVCVLKQDVDSLDFEKLFAYSLRIFENRLSKIYPFLNFHFKENFDNNFSDFHHFLEIVLTQHDTLLSKKVVKFVRKWMLENPIVNSVKSKFNTSNITKHQSLNSKELDDELMEASQEKIPEGYIVVDLRITRINTMKYFSFFYKTNAKNGKPIISMEDFIAIFKYGIAIPPQPQKKPVQLNLVGVAIGNINYAIYHLFSEYSRNSLQKREVMKFMGYHFVDFQKRIANEASFNCWNKNLNERIKPKKNIIDLPELPKEE